MNESKKDYSLDKPAKYYAKYGTWAYRLPLKHDGDELLYAHKAVTQWGEPKCPYCMNPSGNTQSKN